MSTDPETLTTPTIATHASITIDSKNEAIKKRFFAHDLLKQTGFASHYVAEDVEADGNVPNTLIYYFLKVNHYNHEGEYQSALAYYQKLQSYCKQRLAKADIIKLHHMFNLEDPENNYYELALLFDLGESDRIDITQIQTQQITKFLKSLCLLLVDLKSKNDLYHGNIFVKNIILADNELKISGFKNIFLHNPAFHNWKTELCQRYSHYRADLYMIGLIWLRFLGSDIEEITKSSPNLDTLVEKIDQKYAALDEDKKTNIVSQFLNLKDHGPLNLDDALLLFDEYFILETRRMMQAERNGGANFNSITDTNRDSAQQSRVSDSREGNVFNKGLNDSEIDNMTFKNDGVARDSKINVEGGQNNEFYIPDNVTFDINPPEPSNHIEIKQKNNTDKRHSENSVEVKSEPRASEANAGPKSEKHVVANQIKNNDSLTSFQNPVNDSFSINPNANTNETHTHQSNPITGVGVETVTDQLHPRFHKNIHLDEHNFPHHNEHNVHADPHANTHQGLGHHDAKHDGIEHPHDAKPEDTDHLHHDGTEKHHNGTEPHEDKPEGAEAKEIANDKRDSKIDPKDAKKNSVVAKNDKPRASKPEVKPNNKRPSETGPANAPAKDTLKKKEDKPKTSVKADGPRGSDIKKTDDKKPSVSKPSVTGKKPSVVGKPSVAKKDSSPDLPKSEHPSEQKLENAHGEEPKVHRETDAEKADHEKLEEAKRLIDEFQAVQEGDAEPPKADEAEQHQATKDLHDQIEEVAQLLPEYEAQVKLSEKKGSHPEMAPETDPMHHTDHKESDLLPKPKDSDKPKDAEPVEMPRKKLNKREQLDQMIKKLEVRNLPLDYYDHEHTIALHFKKTKQQKVPEVELTNQQKENIQKKIEENQKKKLEREKEKTEQAKANAEKNFQSQKEEAEKLKQKIEMILEKKLEEKKKTPLSEYYKTEEAPDIHQHRAHSPGHQNPAKDRPNKSPGKMYQTEPHLNKSPLKGTQESLPISKQGQFHKGKYNKVQKSPAVFSTVHEKEDLFTYNCELKNKNVPFKKLVNNPVQYIKSRSPSPINTQKLEGQKEHAVDSSPIKDGASKTGNINKLRQFPGGRTADLQAQNEQPLNELRVALEAVRQDELPVYMASYDPEGLNGEVFGAEAAKKLKGPPSDDAIMSQFVELEIKGDPEALDKFAEEKLSELSLPANQIKMAHQMVIAAHAQNNDNKSKKYLVLLLENLAQNPASKDNKPLLQALALQIADLETKHEKFDGAIKLLESPIFSGTNSNPEAWSHLLESSLTQANRPIELAEFYERQIEQNVGDSFKHLDVSKLFINISKILELLGKAGENMKIVKFYFRIIALLQKIKKLNESLHLKEHDYENLIECFILNTFRFANKHKNYNLSNFLVGESLKNNLVDYVHNFNESERIEFAKLILEFCWHLKALPGYGSYKDNYIKDLTFAKNVIKQCDLNADNLKLSLLVNFNRGVFYLKEENYPKAEQLFDKCLATYYAFFNEADQDLYAVLFNLGKTLFQRGKLLPSIYYFNRVLDEQCKDKQVKDRSIKKLAEAFFILEDFKKSMAIGEEFLLDNFAKRAPRNYYKYLVIFYLANERTNSENFAQFFKKLAELTDDDLTQEVYWYFRMFKSFQKIFDDNHNYKENKKYLALLEELASPTGNQAERTKKLVHAGGAIFHKFVELSDAKLANPSEHLVKSLRDEYLTVEENTLHTSKFLYNLIYAFLHALPLFNERKHNHNYRQEMYEKIVKSVPIEATRSLLLGAIRAFSSKQENNTESFFREVKTDESEIPNAKKLQKLPSELILHDPIPDLNDCVCLSEFKNNPELQKLVKSFLKQMKNMLFLGVVENVLTYYVRFEKSLIELHLNYPKYNYIKKLIRFHLAKDAKAEVDKNGFVALLDSLFSEHNICGHDLKLVIVILEGFKDLTYLKLFTIYLDQFHPSHAKIVFKREFYDQFVKKANRVTETFYQQINNAKYYDLENCFFMHHLESQHFINIDKQFSFKLFLRERHDLLNDYKFRELFSRYVGFEDLHLFDLRYHIYSAIVKVFKKEHTTTAAILTEFQTNFLDSLTKVDTDENKVFGLVYELLLLCNLIKFENDLQTAGVFINVMDFIIKKFHFGLNFQFSRVLSLIGNIFFKFGNVEACLKVKQHALDLLRDDSQLQLAEPPYMPNETKDLHYYHVLSFLVMANLELNRPKDASDFCDQLDKLQTYNDNIKFNKMVLRSLVFLSADKMPEALKSVYEAVTFFGQMKLDEFLNKMYQAILDKVTFMIVAKSESREELEVVKKKSRLSISKLYEKKD